MHRFYLPGVDFNNPETILTDPKEIHHAKDVLMLKNDDTIHVFNNQNQEALGIIVDINKQGIKIQIKNVYERKIIYPQLILACAIPKKSKFEMIIENATELGVAEILPVKTARTEIKLSADLIQRKLARFETVAINAAKQCKRVDIPQIHPVTEFKKAVDQLKSNSIGIIPSLSGSPQPIKELLGTIAQPKRIAFFIGPEGDFTAQEYAYAHEQGLLPVTLGETILKVETAAISVLAFSRLYLNNK